MRSVILTLLLFGSPVYAFDHSHSEWAEVLGRYLQVQGPSSRVKYIELSKDLSGLNSYINAIQGLKKPEYESWSKDEKLAFLFNAYNALTVKFVLDGMKTNPDMRSIKDLGSFLTTPWKKKFFKILDEEGFLDHIEHGLARPHFDEPRMHFAFNCASVGCPALQKEAFTSKKLESQLDSAAKGFLSDQSRNRYNSKYQTLELSMIFKWYGGDFEKSKRFGSLKKFLSEHMPLDYTAKTVVQNGDAKIIFLDYDWGLNRL